MARDWYQHAVYHQFCKLGGSCLLHNYTANVIIYIEHCGIYFHSTLLHKSSPALAFKTAVRASEKVLFHLLLANASKPPSQLGGLGGVPALLRLSADLSMADARGACLFSSP